MNKFFKYYVKDRIVLGIKWFKLLLFTNKIPYLIFTMAKVGSLSIYSSLKKQKPLHSIFHIHSLDYNEHKENLELCKEKGILPDSRNPIDLINKQIIEKNKKVKIISLVRDPIERNLSAFFDAFKLYVGVSPEEFNGTMQDLEIIYHKSLPHNYAVNWFDNQFIKATGINVYDYKFPIQKEHVIIKIQNIEVLIMKTNCEDGIKESLLSKFCDCANFRLTNTNQTKVPLYNKFKRSIKFSESYLNKQYNSKYALHFFSEKERMDAINRWVKN